MKTAAMTDHIDTESVQSPVLALNFPETATFIQTTPSTCKYVNESASRRHPSATIFISQET
jgi:hypothetical protein